MNVGWRFPRLKKIKSPSPCKLRYQINSLQCLVHLNYFSNIERTIGHMLEAQKYYLKRHSFLTDHYMMGVTEILATSVYIGLYKYTVQGNPDRRKCDLCRLTELSFCCIKYPYSILCWLKLYGWILWNKVIHFLGMLGHSVGGMRNLTATSCWMKLNPLTSSIVLR